MTPGSCVSNRKTPPGAGIGGCEQEGEATLRPGLEPQRLWLPAGRYHLKFSGDVNVATELVLKLERIDEP